MRISQKTSEKKILIPLAVVDQNRNFDEQKEATKELAENNMETALAMDFEEPIQKVGRPAKPYFIFLKELEGYLNMKSLDKKTVGLNCSRVRKLFNKMNTDNYREIFDCKKLMQAITSMNIRDSDTPIMQQTARMYIAAVQHICKFFTRFPKFDPYCSYSKVMKLRADLDDFSEMKKKRVQEELFRKNQGDVEKMPTPQCLEKYINSDMRENAIKQLNIIKKYGDFDTAFYRTILGYFHRGLLR